MIEAELEHEVVLVESFDGTKIAARAMGAGEGMPLLVVNAVGANLAIWRRALIDVARVRPVVTWDHRGLYSSGPPVSDRMDARAHAEDALAVMDHLGHEGFALVSWSNGSRIALEIAYDNPDRCRSLLLVSGGHGHPMTRSLKLEVASLLPVVASVAKYFGPAVGAALRRLLGRPELTGLIRQSGLVGATADTTALIELLRGIAECDQSIFLRSFQEVVGDSAIDLLGDITVPAMLIGGDHDQFVSRSLLEETACGLGGAPVVIYEGATHYLPIEFPARLSNDLRSFLDASGGPQPE